MSDDVASGNENGEKMSYEAFSICSIRHSFAVRLTKINL